ncbi:hypothetical protein WA538_002680 [Blastocystis sp. DL]
MSSSPSSPSLTSLKLFAVAIALVLTIASVLIALITNAHFFISSSRILLTIIAPYFAMSIVYTIHNKSSLISSWTERWPVYRALLFAFPDTMNNPAVFNLYLSQFFVVLLLPRVYCLLCSVGMFFHLRSFQSLMEEKVALSYFQVMDVDGDGKLSENDLLKFFYSLHIVTNSNDVKVILRHAEARDGIPFQSFKKLLQREKDVMEQLDKDIAAVIEERKETVAPMEIHALRTFMEPISLLYRGVHETEKAMSRNRGIEQLIGLIAGTAVFCALVGMIIWSALTLLFSQFCGVVAPYTMTDQLHSLNKPSLIRFRSTMPRGQVVFDIRQSHERLIQIDRTSCSKQVMNPFTSHIFSNVTMKEITDGDSIVWNVSVIHSKTAIQQFEKQTMLFSYNVACISDYSTFILDQSCFPSINAVIMGESYDFLLTSPREFSISSLSLQHMSGTIHISQVCFLSSARISSNIAEIWMEYVCDKNTISASSFSITANRLSLQFSHFLFSRHSMSLRCNSGLVQFSDGSLGDGALSFTSETAPILLQRMTLGHAQVVTSYGAVEIEDVEITAGKLLNVTTLTGPISVKRLRLKNAAAELAVGEGEVEVDFHDATFEGTMTLFSTYGTIEIVRDGESEKVDGMNYVMSLGNASDLISVVAYRGRIIIRL